MQNFGNPVLYTPSSDFRSVRDRRRAMPLYFDIDLTTARSFALGNALTVSAAGTALYIDANPSDGNAIVHFQDQNSDKTPVPLYVSPGSIFTVPFTQLTFENTSQVGKKIRVVYGVDTDFQPGSVAQQSISGSISTIEAVYGKSAVSQAFSGYGSMAGVAGQVSVLALWNPVGSGKYLYVDEVTANNVTAIATQLYLQSVTSLGNLVFLLNASNKFIGGPAGVGQIYNNNAASTAGVSNIFDSVQLTAAGSAKFLFTSPVIIPPGLGLGLFSSAVNDSINVFFNYTENASN